MLLDIDHFKAINDTHGHDAGDKVLIEFVTLLKNNIRKTDSLARWGGEEFLLICEDTTIDIAIALANKCIRLIEVAKFPNDIPVTCSIGVAPVNSSDISISFKQADVALYQAKEQGRNRVCSAAV